MCRRLRFIRAAAAAAGVTLIVLSGSATPTGAQAREGVAFVGVIDQAGKPVEGLGPEDFIVRADGVAREVVRVTKATDPPIQLALLVDNSQAISPHLLNMRKAVETIIDELAPEHELAIIGLADRPTILANYSTNRESLRKTIGRLFAQPGAGMYLLDAIVETTRGFRKREAARPVILALVTEGVEFSNYKFEHVLDAIADSGAAFHAIIIETGESARSVLDDSERNRNIVIDRGTRESGGRRENILSSMSLPDTARSVVHELNNQYKVTFGQPEQLIPAERVTVTVNRPGVRVHAQIAKPPRGA